MIIRVVPVSVWKAIVANSTRRTRINKLRKIKVEKS